MVGGTEKTIPLMRGEQLAQRVIYAYSNKKIKLDH